jgi:DNA-3-methyladenine glycosylase I
LTAVLPGHPVTGADGLARCPWAVGHPVDLAYHDSEWGLRVQGEAAYFERLSLEVFQSGLSWRTILLKREAFREAFAGFDADAVAAFGDDDVARLMAEPRIVRNRRKIEATLANARATVALRADGGLEALVASHAPSSPPVPARTQDVPPSTPESTALAADLKRAGYRHVGPTTMYALMQAIGIVDDHLERCHRRGAASS